MTRARPPLQAKRLLLASAGIAVPTAAGFLSSTGKLVVILPLAFLSLAALPFYLGSLLNYRSGKERWVFTPGLLIFVGSLVPASIGGHSVWLTTFGETLHCRVENVERHPSSRGSDSFSADLLCGDRKLTFFPAKSRPVKPVSTELDVVVDKTGFFGTLEPEQISWRYNLLFLAGLLASGGFIFLVAWLPVREPAPAEEGE
jgi:hypothetical protein